LGKGGGVNTGQRGKGMEGGEGERERRKGRGGT